jgi:transglutaminase-like putative cysteine protease
MAGLMSLDRTARVSFHALTPEQATETLPPRWTNPNDGSFVEEITYIRSNAAVDSGESYTVVSEVSQASINQLREAGTNYPDWITGKYLQLPPLTDRTLALAQEVTAEYETPFDKAQAIERYLRNAIKYNERIAPPPPGVDKIDYVLFELQEAYCDYYATAMVAMLRSVGVPARMAAGFSRGTFDSERQAFHVINADAHSWVEVYFPKYGWIEFEPTAAQPNIIRPIAPEDDGSLASGAFPNADTRPDGGRDSLERPENIPIDEEAFGSGSFLSFTLPFFGNQINLSNAAVGNSFLGLFLLVLLAAGGVAYWWHRQQIETSKSIFKLYEGMLKLANWMGAALYPWQTPYEHASILQQRLPRYQHEVETITDDYVHQTFSPAVKAQFHAETTLTHESDLAWQRIRPEMGKLILKRWFSWPKKR